MILQLCCASSTQYSRCRAHCPVYDTPTSERKRSGWHEQIKELGTVQRWPISQQAPACP